MLDIYHFSHGWLTPLLSYIMSFIGCLLGLQCAARARQESRTSWLGLSALAIGGTGIWVMHFIAMLGFSIEDAQIRYNVPITLFSAVTAIVVVWIGLMLVVKPEPTLPGLLAGGTITGLGVAGMHYTGMYAMKSDAAVTYNAGLVGLSVLIAVVAATAALWFTLHIDGAFATIGAALIMGVAVSGMHYTGMASMHAHAGAHHGTPSGAEALQLLGPLIAGISIVTMLLLISVGLTSIERTPVRRTPTDASGPATGVGLAPPRRSDSLPADRINWWEDRSETQGTGGFPTNQYWPSRPSNSSVRAESETARPRAVDERAPRQPRYGRHDNT
ncbi:MHYT domain-containing protein [Nocardia noduli]|uniref:MHYT domain-containing protein n=1 Tax=Nocardia noduli TaxID=2815722 RepID=UPI001C2364AF|nr:MHYT domain-containing protein [Nocardia noduli]